MTKLGNGSQRTVAARNVSVRIFAAVVLFVLFAMGAAARADDYGAASDVRTVRTAVPVLMAAYLRFAYHNSAVIRTTDVVVNGNDAVAYWSTGGVGGGLVGLTRRYGRWWLTGKVTRGDSFSDTIPLWYTYTASQFAACIGSYAFKATPDELIAELHISPATASLALAHIPAVAADVAALAAWRKANPHGVVPATVPDCYDPFPKLSYRDYSAGYRAELAWSSPKNLDIARFAGRAPTRAEFLGNPGSDSVYFFSFNIGGDAAVRVTEAALDVWCPFVLDPNVRYSLTLAGAGPVVGPLVGTLRDNTLHFDLPPFTATPGSSVMGQIDGH